MTMRMTNTNTTTMGIWIWFRVSWLSFRCLVFLGSLTPQLGQQMWRERTTTFKRNNNRRFIGSLGHIHSVFMNLQNCVKICKYEHWALTTAAHITMLYFFFWPQIIIEIHWQYDGGNSLGCCLSVRPSVRQSFGLCTYMDTLGVSFNVWQSLHAVCT